MRPTKKIIEFKDMWKAKSAVEQANEWLEGFVENRDAKIIDIIPSFYRAEFITGVITIVYQE